MADRPEIKPADVRLWRERWSAERLEQINLYLTRFWRQKTILPQPLDLSVLGLDTHEGRADLRGITISYPLARIDLTHVDFSGLRFISGGQLGPFSRFFGCCFDRAEKPGNVRQEFERCSFNHANLLRAVLGRTFIGCSFQSANLQTSLANETVFRECVFDGANLRHIQWTRCRFEACRFEGCRFDRGSISGSSFFDCVISKQLLEDADVMLERVAFEG